MKNILAFDFSVDKENKTITIKREFAAELPIVWDAFTKQEILDEWWAPKPWKARTKTMEFKEGGTRRYAMVGPNGEEHWAFFNYQTIQKQKKFSGVDGFTDPDGNINKEMPQMHWTVSFTGKGDVTLVEIVITSTDLKQLEMIISMGFKDGMTIALQGLDELLTSRKK